jgi:sortase (surface protein transpeptidase)
MEVGEVIQIVWDGTLLEYEVSEKIIVTPEEVPDLVNQK